MTGAAQTMEAELIVGLGDPGDHGAEATGTKAANLARLAASGFPVPDGFVVTTAACDRIAAGADFPQELRARIGAHLDRLGPGPVAVRSSGTAEDLGDASYAGQYETVLNVEGLEAVIEAIGRCLDSASSEQVRAYRKSEARAPMAVLVQRMVPAVAAGVAFTANPVTGDAEVLVSAVKGLGERLVSGESTPDEWVLRGPEVSCVSSPEEALDRHRVADVARLAVAVEKLFGSPQDVEWAATERETFILQARPITALPVAPHIEVPSEGFWQKDDAHFPTPLTPFGASVYLPAMEGVMRPVVEEFGLMLDGMEQRSLGGEVYLRAVPFGGRDRPAPPPWAMWLAARLVPALRRRARAAEAAVAAGLPERLLDRWEGEWRAAFGREFQELRSIDMASLGDDALLAHLDRLKEFLQRGEEVHFRLVAPLSFALYELGATCKELLGLGGIRALDLVTGASDASAEPGRELRSLAQRIAADPAALHAITSSDGDGMDRLREAAPAFGKEFDEYLERYGHRPVSYDPGDATLFERPEMVAGLLIQQVRDATSSSGGPGGPPDALSRARADLSEHSEEDRARFERAVAYARRAYGQREDNIFWLDNQPCALLRYCALEFGRRLAERGVLARPDDAVFLEDSELCEALAGGETEPLHGLVHRRKAERAWVTAHPGPLSYGKAPGPPPDLSPLPPALRLVNTVFSQLMGGMAAPAPAQDVANELRGLPASPGRYSGTVRVIRDQTEFAKLAPGDVLVAPATSPAWSVLFLHAGAVVTDGGGVLSHTAVIAREYGVPAVLATGEATRRLSDGDLVTVDGTTGVVSIG